MNVFELVATLTLNKSSYEEGLKDAQEDATDTSSGIGALFSKAGLSMAVVGATAVAVGKKAVDAVVDITEQSVSAYSSYEQLTGGVKKLFGTSADEIMNLAQNAYKTAGMSANEYMDTVTSFSASLISSLGGNTKEAVDYADRAITAMSDNANTFGTDMESVQNAFMGFAKENYTMLDNLKLGYAGTKEGMKQLISDASEMTGAMSTLGVTVDSTDMSFANIVNAIAVVQENMGIAGTTAKEASSTIEGSIKMVKASWENLLTAMADPDGDMTTAIDNFSESLSTAGSNVIPAVMRALNGLGEVLSQAVPELFTELVSALESYLPNFTSSCMKLGANLISGIGKALPSLLEGLIEALTAWAEGLADNADDYASAYIDLAEGIVEALIRALPKIWTDALPRVIEAIIKMIPELIVAIIDAMIEAVGQLGDALADSFGPIIESIGNTIVNGFKSAIGSVKNFFSSTIPSLGQSLADGISNIPSKFEEMVTNIAFNLGHGLTKIKDWVSNVGSTLSSTIPQVISTATEFFSELPSKIAEFLSTALSSIREWATNMLATIRQRVPQMINQIVTYFAELPSKLAEIGRNAIEGFIKGFEEKWEAFKQKLAEMVQNVKDAFQTGLDTHSPSRWFKWLGEMCVDGFNAGLDSFTAPTSIVTGLKDSTVSSLQSVGGSVGGTTYNQTINVNQQISTADELARAVRIESRYGLMRGTALG